MKSRFGYPIFLNLQGSRCAVIGGGPVALRKAKDLLAAGAKVRVVAPHVRAGFHPLVRARRVSWTRRKFRPGDLKGAWLIVAAADDEQVNRAVARAAQRLRIWVNVVDRPALCSFIVPSVVRRGRLQMAISTGGVSPALAKWIRKDLQSRYGLEMKRLLSVMGQARGVVQNKVKPSARRKRLFEKALRAYIQTLQESIR